MIHAIEIHYAITLIFVKWHSRAILSFRPSLSQLYLLVNECLNNGYCMLLCVKLFSTTLLISSCFIFFLILLLKSCVSNGRAYCFRTVSGHHLNFIWFLKNFDLSSIFLFFRTIFVQRVFKNYTWYQCENFRIDRR